ncbi:MAG: hypothetical protein M0R80_15140 [Proteobacteria bacterium]|jgi:hypothetical protein|nr:hypothetical protein [Pseudomonadota bacterium]
MRSGSTLRVITAILLVGLVSVPCCDTSDNAACNESDARACEDEHTTCTDECETDAGVDTECLVDCKTAWCDCLDSRGCDAYLVDLGC